MSTIKIGYVDLSNKYTLASDNLTHYLLNGKITVLKLLWQQQFKHYNTRSNSNYKSTRAGLIHTLALFL